MRRSLPFLLATAVAAAAPAAARADVQVTPSQVVVRVPGGAQATVERSAFRLTVAGADGRPALQQVPGDGAIPTPLAPVADPVPGGSSALKRPVLYAPLTFTVGAKRNVQVPETQYAGNLLTSVDGGVQFSAGAVEGVRADGDVAQLTVGTTDPSGRKLEVTIGPGPALGTVRVKARVTPDAGVVSLADSFSASPGEPFRGFGGRHNAIDQHGEAFFNWLQQENTGSGALQPATNVIPGTERDRFLFPNGPQSAYDVQSLFFSDAFGFLLDRDELSEWRMASDRQDAWRVSVAAPQLDYVVAPGAPKQAAGALTAATGRHRVPPAWLAGTMFDRAVKYPSDNPVQYEAQVRDDIRKIDRYHLPVDGYRIEGWEFFSRDKLRGLIGDLRRRGIHAVLYFRAFVGQDEIGTDSPRSYDEAVNKGYVAKTPTGQPYLFVTNFNALGAVIDFTNPEAVRWWQGRIREALDLGADGFMQDFGEQVQEDMVFADGSTGATMHNRLPVLYHRATRQAVDAYMREHPDRQIGFYTRAGYSGTPGAAAEENMNFPGDETTDFSRSSGLASLTTDMLSRGIGGAFGYTTDIGGYFDLGPYQPTTKELFLRWAEWTALSPAFRLHGSVGAGTHTPWSFDDETVRLYTALSQLHLRARPLILRLWREAVATGVPVARPLWLEAPGDAKAAAEDQEWMLGDDVLVAPVVEQGATRREVLFPAGCWQQPETGVRYAGGRSATVPAALDQLPYFFRCGRTPFRAVDAGGSVLPSSRASRSCSSRRRFRIHLTRRLVSARVMVNGRSVRVLRGRRLRSVVDLRGLPRGRFTVRVVGRTRSGRTLVRTRRYRTCVPRRRA